MEIKARILGRIIEVTVKEGDAVSVRQPLGKMGAMKMEQPIFCPVAGTVKQVAVSVEDKVSTGQTMFIVE